MHTQWLLLVVCRSSLRTRAESEDAPASRDLSPLCAPGPPRPDLKMVRPGQRKQDYARTQPPNFYQLEGHLGCVARSDAAVRAPAKVGGCGADPWSVVQGM